MINNILNTIKNSKVKKHDHEQIKRSGFCWVCDTCFMMCLFVLNVLCKAH